jgi:hypothetical protein
MDQCVLEKQSDGQSRVLAAFAHRDVVESHVALARSAGLEPDEIYMSTACLASVAPHVFVGESGRTALVNVASGGLEVLVLRARRVEYGRGVAMTHDHRLAHPSEELAQEVRVSLAAYRRESEDGSGADEIVVCSEWADVAAVSDALAAETGLECRPARITSPLVTRGADRLPGIPLVLLGAALAAQGRADIAISLMPESVVRERERRAGRTRAAMIGGLITALLLAVCGLYAQALVQRSAYLRQLDARLQAVRPVAESVEAKKRQLIRLQEHVDRTGTVLDLLARLCDYMPDSGVNITRFSFSHGERIILEGRADSEGDVFLLSEALREAGRTEVPQFVRTRQGPSRPVTERDREVVSYTIVIPFPVAEEGPETESDYESLDEY